VSSTRREVSRCRHEVVEIVVSRLGGFSHLDTGQDGLVHCTSLLVAWATAQLERLLGQRGRFEIERVYGGRRSGRCLWCVCVVVGELEVAWERDRDARLVRSHGV
jgi:hypothetical protein